MLDVEKRGKKGPSTHPPRIKRKFCPLPSFKEDVCCNLRQGVLFEMSLPSKPPEQPQNHWFIYRIYPLKVRCEVKIIAKIKHIYKITCIYQYIYIYLDEYLTYLMYLYINAHVYIKILWFSFFWYKYIYIHIYSRQAGNPCENDLFLRFEYEAPSALSAPTKLIWSREIKSSTDRSPIFGTGTNLFQHLLPYHFDGMSISRLKCHMHTWTVVYSIMPQKIASSWYLPGIFEF